VKDYLEPILEPLFSIHLVTVLVAVHTMGLAQGITVAAILSTVVEAEESNLRFSCYHQL